MKRFWEYGFEKRVEEWGADREEYDFFVEAYKNDPEPTDSEKNAISMTLYELGDMAGAREAAESIEDERYRKESLFWLDKLEFEAANPGKILD